MAAPGYRSGRGGPGLSLTHSVRQAQTLSLTPQLRQAIQLLQMTAAQVDAVVDEALESNPLLRLGGAEEDPQPSPMAAPRATPRTAPTERGGGPPGPVGGAAAARLWDRIVSATGASSAGGGGAGHVAAAGEDLAGIEDRVAARPSLHDHLARQIAESFDDPREAAVAEHLAGNLDGAGYLTDDLSSLAAMAGTDPETVRHVLARVREFEPAGLFAADLAECLSLQLAARGRLDDRMCRLMANLPMLADGRPEALASACGVDGAELAAMIATLRTLDPRPGAAFDHGSDGIVVPDIVMRRRPGGGWDVAPARSVAGLEIDEESYRRLLAATVRGEDRAYLRDQRETARWLIRALDRRMSTVVDVAREIVRHQQAFLVEPGGRRRPLTRRAVAEALELHESTISRATNGKYIQTPRGTFELRALFGGAIAAVGGGDAHAAETVRARLGQLVRAESPDRPLSDADLAGLLRAEGFDIARRTVAKYREAMAIPSSARRRRAAAFRERS